MNYTPSDNILSNKSKKNKKDSDEKPYFNNTNDTLGLYKNPSLQSEEEEEDNEDKKPKGVALLKQIYGSGNPCWKGYEQYGMKEKNGKQVPNCIPVSNNIKKGSSRKKYKMLELFKGTGSVGKQANKMGFDVISLDLDPIYTPDIETDILKWDYKNFSKENAYIPDFIWASPPCNTFSPMVYPLKERDTKTAEPKSDRAKLGTQILYKTLEIIRFFLKLNPKLLFVIENPRGMMRMDPKMKQLNRETTLYCLYNDCKIKPTDFWNNFPNGLDLKTEKSCPSGKQTCRVQDVKLNKRYSIPSTLIKKILQEFKIVVSKKIKGGCGNTPCQSSCKSKLNKTYNKVADNYTDIINHLEEHQAEGVGDPKDVKQSKYLKKELKNINELHLIPANKVAKKDPLYKVSNPKEVQKKAFEIYGKDVIIYKSDNPKKKYQVIDRNTGKWVKFGNPDYEDFTHHLDKKRQDNYLKRALNIKGKWRDNVFSPNWLSILLLW